MFHHFWKNIFSSGLFITSYCFSISRIPLILSLSASNACTLQACYCFAPLILSSSIPQPTNLKVFYLCDRSTWSRQWCFSNITFKVQSSRMSVHVSKNTSTHLDLIVYVVSTLLCLLNWSFTLFHNVESISEMSINNNHHFLFFHHYCDALRVQL